VQRQRRSEANELFDHVDQWTTFILANILWAIFSIPLITLPAATAGLFAVMSRWTRGIRPELFHEFFGAMRRCWRQSTAIAVIDLLIGALLMVNLNIFPLMDMSNPVAMLSRSVTIFVGVLVALVNLYVWSLLVLESPTPMPLRQLLDSSLKLLFAHPLWSLGILLLGVLPLGIALLLPAFILIVGAASASAFVITWGTWRIIHRYLDADDLQQLG
jgi:uncharacterized membrane protein YesL